MSKKLFQKGSSEAKKKELTEVKNGGNTRTLAMVLRSKRELLTQSKEQEDDNFGDGVVNIICGRRFFSAYKHPGSLAVLYRKCNTDHLYDLATESLSANVENGAFLIKKMITPPPFGVLVGENLALPLLVALQLLIG